MLSGKEDANANASRAAGQDRTGDQNKAEWIREGHHDALSRCSGASIGSKAPRLFGHLARMHSARALRIAHCCQVRYPLTPARRYSALHQDRTVRFLIARSASLAFCFFFGARILSSCDRAAPIVRDNEGAIIDNGRTRYAHESARRFTQSKASEARRSCRERAGARASTFAPQDRLCREGGNQLIEVFAFLR